MSNVGPEHRSFLPIDHIDLARMASIGHRDLEQYFVHHPHWTELYADRLLCVALCQGAALHYLDGTTGINDFDVYSFYCAHADKQWPPRRRKVFDFGDPKFGQSKDKPNFVGRRIDCLRRSIEAAVGEEQVTVVQRYLRAGRTETARLLRRRL